MLDDARLEVILRALSDATRRRLLELLAEQPGLSTSQLAARVPGITRWGVMKHLDVLRSAGLVQTLSQGRQRRHYREDAALDVLDRWLADQPARRRA